MRHGRRAGCSVPAAREECGEGGADSRWFSLGKSKPRQKAMARTGDALDDLLHTVQLLSARKD
eukprot:scaffold188190_cov28-Tisochrysis_lutea.AAC.2